MIGDAGSAGLENRLERLERPPVITMTTDFGHRDGYVGAMQGVIYTFLPDARIVDISHDVSPQQIDEGAFILYRAYRYFPASAIHIAVVDPGVGGDRRPLLLTTGHGIFIGPDNGIFTYVLRAEMEPGDHPHVANKPAWAGGMWGIAPNWAGDGRATPLHKEGKPSPKNSEEMPHAYHLNNSDYWLSSVSNTFHGRDIFAPAAAHLASGAQPDRMGEPVDLDSLVKLPVGEPRVQKTRTGTTATGQIVYIDRFGNIITNLPDRLLGPLLAADTAKTTVEIGDHRIEGLSRSYSDVHQGQALALIGSEKLLEIAVREASAAQRMKVRIGDTVRVVVKI